MGEETTRRIMVMTSSDARIVKSLLFDASIRLRAGWTVPLNAKEKLILGNIDEAMKIVAKDIEPEIRDIKDE
jgi:hypothetical protein